jgi:hypothetical protein
MERRNLVEKRWWRKERYGATDEERLDGMGSAMAKVNRPSRHPEGAWNWGISPRKQRIYKKKTSGIGGAACFLLAAGDCVCVSFCAPLLVATNCDPLF